MQQQVVEFAGQSITIPSLALLIMLAGILLPTAFYSIRLRNPTPAQLLVAVCIALFSSVVYLWILDATSILVFRSEWVSKSIYGAAIASVLGTSVAVYKDSFQSRKYVYEGPWNLALDILQHKNLIVDYSIVLTYSEAAGTYWGYSKFIPNDGNRSTPEAIEVKELFPEEGEMVCVFNFQGNRKDHIKVKLNRSEDKKRFSSIKKSGEDNYAFTLSRDKIT